MKAPSITSHDVARAAGVSQPTVSRALRGDSRLSADTIERVQAAAAALHYVPSRRGRNLATRSTGQVGIVVTDLGNPFYLEILNAVHEELARTDLRMLVLTSDRHDRIELEQLVDGALDGAILTTTVLGSDLPGRLHERGFPFVLLNREVDDCPGDVCVVDNDAGARLVARELLDLGHREIAAIFGPENTSTGRDREQAFRAELAEAGLSIGPDRWRRCPFVFDAGRQATLELLGTVATPPTALFCANDMIALGAFDALRSANVRVPEEMTLIGFDDVLLAGWHSFQLTTVSQRIERMAQTATELLLSRMAATDAPPSARRMVLEPELRRRHTHGPPPARG